MGIDATRKWPAEGFTRPWPADAYHAPGREVQSRPDLALSENRLNFQPSTTARLPGGHLPARPPGHKQTIAITHSPASVRAKNRPCHRPPPAPSLRHLPRATSWIYPTQKFPSCFCANLCMARRGRVGAHRGGKLLIQQVISLKTSTCYGAPIAPVFSIPGNQM